MSNTTSDLHTLWDLIKDIKFGMLVHRHSDGSLQGHPLTTQNKSMDENSVLYFFISQKSEMASRLRTDSNVNVSYADTGADNYVSIAGTAHFSDDAAKKEALFNPIVKAWFPGGVTDPDLALLEVRISHAEYWNAKDSKLTQLFKMAKSAVTGEPPRNMSEHKELNIS
ncbi:MAG: pyridoxamine 5'-phosphate oxidase family protein [Polaromonas sp.]|uniref:pyridoxamine 5'-phosphate oxidase family protein n=1 Tax=Polaromonas sp. TaxID=1869339 RepID=UPI00273068FC|nr:pyridoxamine 5'-phosphate oxidase family protein [Polaromonas sp.]MDP1739980.1 pyridoxamine 5'-phosphate oxidase family protein [Polaromonas sp.]MDP1954697.1 pyridoxamine 5'-phosphate oxidase family protein [Polaromonas sp.]MDP3355479.1 pyridoxamine 5'-phosphate oxidase family protein [Polaromonas sp.]MDP3798133.1 pyridoxamine 5'-phosphate oxidase family protein [Polaromonas sp.]